MIRIHFGIMKKAKIELCGGLFKAQSDKNHVHLNEKKGGKPC